MKLGGLTTINIELTSHCNKSCFMCGRRKIDRDYPEIVSAYGDMDFETVKMIPKQLPYNTVVQFHSNGESLLYPRFGKAVSLFKRQIKCLTTNGKLLMEKKTEIIGNLDIISISVIENDEEKEEQYEIIKKFLKLKKEKKPFVIFRLLGNVRPEPYEILDGLVVKRILHSPMGSFKYKKTPTIPEIGICWDFLNHPCINRTGDMSICVRFDPKRVGVLGNIKEQTIEQIWNGKKRRKWLECHKRGRRDLVPLCKMCEFWGIPRGVD